jgi:polyhydroxybutyrate depolymerase
MERRMALHREWPEAIVAYPTGLPTKTPNDLEGTRNGWQVGGGQDGGRDLKFVDTMLADFQKRYGYDPKRVFAAGHSNGARFCYVLWAERGDQFAAFAPCCSGGLGLIGTCKPKPVFVMGGKNDPIVKFASIDLTISAIKGLNGSGPGKPLGEKCITYPSIKGDLVTYIHEGGHEYQTDANPMIASFFKGVK